MRPRPHREGRVEGLRNFPRPPQVSPYRIPPEIEALIWASLSPDFPEQHCEQWEG